MKLHKDKGRFLISRAILLSDKTSIELRSIAVDCVLAYTEIVSYNKLYPIF